MKTQFIKFSLCIIIVFFSCVQKEKLLPITIHLTTKIDTTLNFKFDYRNTETVLYSYKEKHEKYYNMLLEKYKFSTKNKDPFMIVSSNFFTEKKYYDFLKSKSLSGREKKKADYYFKIYDTTNFYTKPFISEINVLTYFKNKNQYLIIDTDNDGNFNNEKILFFNKKITKTATIQNINYQVFYKNNIINIKRKITISPSPNYFLTNFFIKNKHYKKHASLLKFKDCYKGNFNFQGIRYTFLAQGSFLPRMEYIIHPDTVKVTHTNKINFKYKFKDTIVLANQPFLIDSIDNNLSKVFIKKINTNKPYYGFRKGEILKDFKIKSINGSVLSLLSNKKFLLLDFWGTWCAPCKELTPDLQKLNKNYTNVQLLSVAYDNSLNKVKEYIKKNHLNWVHAYSKKRKGIINDLKITSFPTFILINKERKIIYRGVGKEALELIKKILKSK